MIKKRIKNEIKTLKLLNVNVNLVEYSNKMKKKKKNIEK